MGRGVREEQIASVALNLGQSVEIAATEKFNARRITLTVTDSILTPRPVVRRLPAPPPPVALRPVVIEIYRGDVLTDPAMRPWQPAPRGQR